MPANSSIALILLSVVILALFFALLGGAAVVIALLIHGDIKFPKLPEKPRLVPWRWPSVAAMLLLYFAVNFGVANAFGVLKSQFGWQLGSPVPAGLPVALKSDPAQEASRIDAKTEPAKSVAKPDSRATEPKNTDKDKAERKFSFTETMLLVSVVNLLILALLPPLMKRISGATAADLGLDLHNLGKKVTLGVGTFFVVTPVVLIISALMQFVFARNKHPLEDMLRQGISFPVILLAFLSAAILAPLAEELMFRGILQGWLNRFDRRIQPVESWADLDPSDSFVGSPRTESPFQQTLVTNLPESDPGARPRGRGIPGSILVSSLLFALVHFQQMPAPIPIFFLALALGWLYEATGGIVSSVVLHAAFNAFNTTLMVCAVLAGSMNPTMFKKFEPPPPARQANLEEIDLFRLARAEPAVRFLKDRRGVVAFVGATWTMSSVRHAWHCRIVSILAPFATDKAKTLSASGCGVPKSSVAVVDGGHGGFSGLLPDRRLSRRCSSWTSCLCRQEGGVG